MNDNLEQDRRFMRRALEMAAKGRGYVSPNPMVGAVIVDANNRIIAEGYHREHGGDHAEIDALNQLKDADLSNSTMYVTLEPCTHHGKTPPCADALLESGIGRIVIATRDPNPVVSGRGIRRLREAGRSVIVGILETEAVTQNETYLHFIRTGRPFVTIKVGQSLDGYIALPGGESQWITGALAREHVHELRAAYDAVMVGTRTAQTDDPSLTVRHGVQGRNPYRVVLDRHLELSPGLKLLGDRDPERTILFCDEEAAATTKARELGDRGVRIEAVGAEGNPENLRLEHVIRRLGELDIASLLVEGGAAVIDSMITERLVDKLILYIAPKLLGHGIKPFSRLAVDKLADATTLKLSSAEIVGEDLKVEAYL